MGTPDIEVCGMWQQLTDAARRSVWRADDAARQIADKSVSTEHLLIGLCQEPEAKAAKVLAACGITLDSIQLELEKRIPQGKANPEKELKLTRAGKRAIFNSYREARKLGNDYVGTEHLLLGLLMEKKGLAASVLKSLGLDLEKARISVAKIQTTQTES